MTPERDRWLHGAFAASAVAVVALSGWALVADFSRPGVVEQRIVPALGVVDRCEGCHTEHKGDWLTTHPPERFGCTPCHGGQGMATEATPAHAAALDWERPLFSRAEQQAACGRCHLGQDPPRAPLLQQGRKALVARGCTGCHAIPGLPAPDHAPALDGLRDKLSPGWLRAWLRDPKGIDAAHQMPVFTLSDADLEAVVAYLWTLPGPTLPAAVPEGDSDRGRSALAARRCATCHAWEGRGGTLGPTLSLAGMKLQPNWLFALLRDTHALRPLSRMPGFRLPEQEAADIVAYAQEQWLSDTGEAPWQALELPVQATLSGRGKALFDELGCNGCHPVAGRRSQPPAPALDKLGATHLVDLPVRRDGQPKPRDVPAWVAQKVLDPSAFLIGLGPAARMPRHVQVAAEEALAMGVAIAVLGGKPVPAAWMRHHEPPPVPVPQGEIARLVERFRCLQCHRAGGVGGTVAKVDLDGAGARMQPAWLARFLRDPVTVRMDQAERMPVLGLTPEEARRLAGWIEATFDDGRLQEPPPFQPGDAERGKVLYEKQGCPTCHMAEGGGTMAGPTLDGSRHRLKPAYVWSLLAEPALVPGLRHPPKCHPPACHSLADLRAIVAYVLGLDAAWPWPEDVTATGL